MISGTSFFICSTSAISDFLALRSEFQLDKLLHNGEMDAKTRRRKQDCGEIQADGRRRKESAKSKPTMNLVSLVSTSSSTFIRFRRKAR